jgi:hypothetical protein
MLRRLALLLGSTALAASPSLTATAQEYSSGCEHKPCPVILTPVEAYGVHPPGDDCCCKHGTIVPYYAPLSPTPTCARWRVTHLTPYYCGYCAHKFHGPKPPPYGSDGGWGPGPGPDGPSTPPFNYGVFTSVLQDDTVFWKMGGNGLVPYGTPPPRGGPPDIVDMIQLSRRGGCCSPPTIDGIPAAPVVAGPAPATISPAEKPKGKEGPPDREDKGAPPGEKRMLPE